MKPLDRPASNSGRDVFIFSLCRSYGHCYAFSHQKKRGERLLIFLECPCGASAIVAWSDEIMVALSGPPSCVQRHGPGEDCGCAHK